MDGLGNRTWRGVAASLLLMQALACTDLMSPTSVPLAATVSNSDSPAVTAATFNSQGVDLWFNQAMDTQATVSAVTVYKLNAHVQSEVSLAGNPVDRTVTALSARHLRVSWVFFPGSYVLEIDSAAQGVSGRGLDGRTGLGQAAGVHRPDDDWLDAPSPYISQAIHIGNSAPVFQSVPPHSYLTVTEIVAWRAFSSAGSAESLLGSIWRFGQSRTNAFAPTPQHLGYQVRFASPAGGRYGLPTPGDVSKYLRLFDGNNSRLGQVAIGLSNKESQELPFGYEVESAFGRAVTVTNSFTNLPITRLRNPGDRMWLFLGESALPGVVSAEVIGIDINRDMFKLSEMAVQISGAVLGATAATNRRWPAGALDGGYALRLTTGEEFPIVTATGSTLFLAESTGTADCDGCQVVLTDVSDRIAAGDTVLLLSDVWYFLFGQPPPTEVGQYFSINNGNLLRSFAGGTFVDLERDGNELIQPPEADNEFVLEVSFRGPNEPRPPYSRVNEGLLYPTVFGSANLECLGDSSNPICVTPIPDENCVVRSVPARAHFSFYTADGESGNFGTADLIERDALTSDQVQVFGQNGQVALDSLLSNRIVIHATPVGTFSTTVLTVELAHQDVNACGPGQRGRRGFREGDRLVISHTIKTIASVDPRTIDGDHDGLAEASAADDWVGIWRDATQTFEPIVRTPVRPTIGN